MATELRVQKQIFENDLEPLTDHPNALGTSYSLHDQMGSEEQTDGSCDTDPSEVSLC